MGLEIKCPKTLTLFQLSVPHFPALQAQPGPNNAAYTTHYATPEGRDKSRRLMKGRHERHEREA